MIKFGEEGACARLRQVNKAEVLKWMRTLALVLTMAVMVGDMLFHFYYLSDIGKRNEHITEICA